MSEPHERFEALVNMPVLLDLADAALRAATHSTDCKFAFCTCGAVQKFRTLSLDYWAARRADAEAPTAP